MNIFTRVWTAFRQGPMFVVFLGLIFFAVGVGLTFQQYLLRQDALQAQGTVISLAESCDDEGCTYRPIVRFTAQNGREEFYNSMYGSSPPAYEVGEIVTLFYQPDNPQKAFIQGEGGIFRVIFTAIGAGIMLVGLAFFANNLKQSYLVEE